jgi:hypothetical protein
VRKLLAVSYEHGKGCQPFARRKYPVQDYRNLKVWERAHQLTLALYKVTTQFPKEELYGLTSQVRRACASIPANVAEGCERNSDAELEKCAECYMRAFRS